MWQGHYTTELNPNLLRSTFSDAIGSDNYQLVNVDTVVKSGARGKDWSVVTKKNESNFNFVTVIYPFSGAGNRINETIKNPALKGWAINSLPFTATGEQLKSLSKDAKHFLFNVRQITTNGIQIEFSELTDVFVKMNDNKVVLQSLGAKKVQVKMNGNATIKNNGKDFGTTSEINPGEMFECVLR